MLGRPPLEISVMGNVYFDTCAYHQPGIDLLFAVIDPANILFGSEMIGLSAALTRRPGIASMTPGGTWMRSG
jgi:4-oxalmesaconate hydratase